MRVKNENLVLNIMPEHVAKHFLGSKKSDEVRSQASNFRNLRCSGSLSKFQ